MRTTNAISYDCLRPSSINETIHAGQIWFTLLMLYFMIALNQNSYRWSHKARYTNCYIPTLYTRGREELSAIDPDW